MKFTVMGSLALDTLETPLGEAYKIMGGSGTYASLAASYFNKQTGLVGIAGGDFPKESIEILRKHGVNLEGLQVKKNQKSFSWAAKYHNSMASRDTLVTELNVLEYFDPIIPDGYQDTKFLMLGNLSPIVQKTALERLKERPKLVLLDTMNFWIDNAQEDLKKMLKLVDVLCINDEEARQLSQEYSLVKAAKIIKKTGPKYLIIKKGENGVMLFGDNQIFFTPALPLEDVYDPTGAGDAFAGGFIGFISSTGDTSFRNMKKAVIYGSAMASFCVEKFGTKGLLYLPKEEIDNRVQEFIDLVQFEIEY